jgi:hypothetical protein
LATLNPNFPGVDETTSGNSIDIKAYTTHFHAMITNTTIVMVNIVTTGTPAGKGLLTR